MNLPALTDTNYGLTIPDNIVPYDVKERVTFEVPKIKTLQPASSNGGDMVDIYHNLYEGSCVGIYSCASGTCVNAATAVDIFNFGYYISANVGVSDTKLTRLSTFYYSNSSGTVVIALTSYNDPWKLYTSTISTLTGSYGIPIGTYTNGTQTYTVNYING